MGKERVNVMKVGVVCSVDTEVEVFREELAEFSVIELDNREYTSAKIGGEELIVVNPQKNTKEDKQECVEKLIQHFEVKRLIFIGFAGAIDYTLSPLAVIIGKNHHNHQNGLTYTASKKMIDMLDKLYPSAIVCDIMTYEYFLENIEEKKKLKTQFPSISAVDMESAFLAEIASVHSIPFVSIRAITDNANDQAQRNYKKYEHLAAGKTVDIVIELLKSKYFDK